MKSLPIDIKALIDEVTDIEGARTTSVSVSIVIDDSADANVAAFVRSAFASASAHARVTIGYFEGAALSPYDGDDMAVIVAGSSPEVGKHAAAIRNVGVPVMVISAQDTPVFETASASGYPIPDGDLIFFTDEADVSFRMGQWVVEACREKRLAFALAFPFVRRPLSVEAVNATAVQNAGIGIVVFIPGADLPVMTLNQGKMLLQIAAAYGQPMGVARAKELAAVVAGGFACRGVARQLIAVVPGAGWVIKAAIGYSGTQAMGRAAIEYFESGGNIGGLAGVVGKARDVAVDTACKAAETPAGKTAISYAKQFARKALRRNSSAS